MAREDKVDFLICYCDCPGRKATKRAKIDAGKSLYQWAEEYMYSDPTRPEMRRAYKVIRGEREAHDLRPKAAQLLLDAYALADGLDTDDKLSPKLVLAALITLLPMRGRALLYFDCCAVLGHDPADR